MNYYYEDKRGEDTCDKCGHTFENLGEKIIIVHIGIKRRNLCLTCAEFLVKVIDLNEQELIINENSNQQAGI